MRRPLLVLAGLVVLVAAGVAVAYFVVFPQSSPKEFAPSTTAAAGPRGAVGGRWRVARGSAAGYRVREKLAFLSAPNEAVGRTTAIRGGATLARAGGRVTIRAASFTADVSRLRSDRAMRDERIRSIGLVSDRYPTATFTLSRPVVLPRAALRGAVVRARATGVLGLHGARRTKTLGLQVRLGRSELEVVGAITFPWGDFGMIAPSVAGFVTVDDRATMEFDLHLTP